MTQTSYHKTALVTGATGYVGSRLVRRLAADGWDVHIIARPGSDLAILHSAAASTTVHRHDGSTEGMNTIIAEARPSVVFHLASLFLAQHQPKDVEPLIRSNVLLGTQLAEAMVKNGVHRLVNTGTAWQHYENAVYNPVCLYAATKQAFDDVLRYYTETTPLKVITLKLFDTYGPGDPRPKLFTLLRTTAREGKTLAMSPGEQLIDLVYIDDAVQGFMLAADRLMTEGTGKDEEYAITSRSPIRLKDLVELYSRIVQKGISVEWGSRPYRPREVMAPWDRGRILPGWEPVIGLEEGIRRMENERA